jgi:hypothetical protein
MSGEMQMHLKNANLPPRPIMVNRSNPISSPALTDIQNTLNVIISNQAALAAALSDIKSNQNVQCNIMFSLLHDAVTTLNPNASTTKMFDNAFSFYKFFKY